MALDISNLPRWHKAPREFRYAFMDRYGIWWWSINRPELTNDGWQVHGRKVYARCREARTRFMERWRESLMERREEEAA